MNAAKHSTTQPRQHTGSAHPVSSSIRTFSGGSRIFLFGLACCLKVALGVGFSSCSFEEASDTEPGPLVAVEPLKLLPGFASEVRFVGKFEARRRSGLGFELGGLLSRVHVDIGDTVEEGQVLAEIDTARLESALLEAEARLRAANADAILAEAELARVEALSQSQVASQREADEAVRVRDTALAQEQAASAGAARIRADLDKSLMLAPFSGTIISRRRDDGAVVSAGEVVLELLETSRLRLRAGISMEISEQWAQGDEIAFKSGTHSGLARVEAILPTEDRATRTRTVLFTPIAEGSSLSFRDGENVEIIARKSVDTPVFALDPRLLVEAERGLWGCYVVVEANGEHRAELRSVEVVYFDDDRAFVVGSLREPGRRGDFFRDTVAVLDVLPYQEGLLGYAFRFELFGNKAWTVTAWQDQASQDAFVRTPAHRAAVQRSSETAQNIRFVTVERPLSSLPLKWKEIFDLIENDSLQYRKKR